jgi:hypothetical protein
MQFSDRLRKRFTKFHHVVGRLYVAGVFVAAPFGFYIQNFEERMGGTRSFTFATVADAGLWMLNAATFHAPVRAFGPRAALQYTEQQA